MANCRRCWAVVGRDVGFTGVGCEARATMRGMHLTARTFPLVNFSHWDFRTTTGTSEHHWMFDILDCLENADTRDLLIALFDQIHLFT